MTISYRKTFLLAAAVAAICALTGCGEAKSATAEKIQNKANAGDAANSAAPVAAKVDATGTPASKAVEASELY